MRQKIVLQAAASQPAAIQQAVPPTLAVMGNAIAVRIAHAIHAIATTKYTNAKRSAAALSRTGGKGIAATQAITTYNIERPSAPFTHGNPVALRKRGTNLG